MAVVITRRLTTIDEDATAHELLDTWVNGNKRYVIDRLERDHPGLTALFITEGILSLKLDRGAVNEVTNKLIEKRAELLFNARP